MTNWSPEIESELTLLIKEWLKHHGRSQADLQEQIQSNTSRMPALIEVLKNDFELGGLQKLVYRLCVIEERL